jgi:hypothetical protein
MCSSASCQKDHMNWGAGFSGSPVDVHQYAPQPITELISLYPNGLTELPLQLTNTGVRISPCTQATTM